MTETAEHGDGGQHPGGVGRQNAPLRPREPSEAGAGRSIGELAREFRISTRAIRFYESRGLLRPIRRGTARIFTRQDCDRLGLIIRAKNLGLTLEEIGDHLAIYDAEPTTLEDVAALRERADRHIATLVGKRDDLQTTLRELREIRARLAADAVRLKKT